ncbi:MAG: SelT/SelW/SelH family protein [Planctomycetes bacterium]|nr:SelT/SelW/SelH family protein [Planctomycetota bacterium]
MTARLLTEYKQKIDELRLIPAGGGCFEVSIDGDLIYSKLKTGSFPDEQAMLDSVGKRL